uniref:Secreted protein n=1 Tax=Anguilla anguilla TaxID=7936 RepID=A0A0E9SBP4_ANGAN
MQTGSPPWLMPPVVLRVFFFLAGIESQTKHHGRRHARQPPSFSAPLRPCRLVPAFGNPVETRCRAVRALSRRP